MNRIEITHEDVADPARLRQRLDQAFAQDAHLLDKLAILEGKFSDLYARQGAGALSNEDRVLLKQLAGGGTSSAAPPTPGLITYVVETFADLPPTATVLNGSTARVRATNLKYVFDGPTRTWVVW